ncbi:MULTISPECIES: hypothetical protein [unclassified Anabaena]|uniref:hypothetical protein n=1 Tax=unclassified Anabaena TaxID=2619674 RepID=UPI000831A174|nr:MULTISPECIES: hypothetical protein [unclassified Anabaena]
MDEIVKKLAGLGLPGILLVIVTAASGGIGSSAAVVAALTGLGGPFGLIGGLGVLGLIASVGDVIAGYGIEAILLNIYAERSKTESVRYLLKEIKDLPITDELKAKLKDQLSPEINTEPEEVQPPKTIEIVEEE